MSQFEAHLESARKKQRQLYLGAVLGIIVLFAIIISVIVITRATRIEILPEEANSTAIITISKGKGVIAGRTLYALSWKPTLIIEAEGFYSRQQQLADTDFGNVMTITLKPLPAKLLLHSSAQDEKTSWLIDGEIYLAGANDLVREFEPGEHHVSVIHPYYQIKELEFSLRRGEVVEQHIELESVQGQITLNSQPEDATISIDEVDIGKTPEVIDVLGGEHKVKVYKAGYEPVNEVIEITREANNAERKYLLEPEKGQVNLMLSPSGGKLLLNNLQVEPKKSFRLAVDKTHKLTYSKPGYFSQSKTFQVSTQSDKTINFDLEQETGKVEISASPDAMISVNGKPAGTTPLKLSLQALPQEITFSKAGYRTVTKRIVPSSESVKLLSENLVPEKVATLQDAPSTYKHKAGGTLKLYKPNDSFEMGAARSEAGQRANEFVKNIRLSRPFYAGVNEVSYAAYQQFDSSVVGNAREPVTGINWSQAAAFCNWLSREEGRKEVYAIQNGRVISVNKYADGYRLLTEAEWEWLARKANRKERTRFVWGDNTVIPKHAVNVADESAKGNVKTFVPRYNDGFAGVAPVGSYDQEISGLFDQGGNVSEWVHDTYSLSPPKPGQVFTDPFITETDDTHVIKGANWRSGSITELRASYREGLSSVRDNVGFRIGRYVYGGGE